MHNEVEFTWQGKHVHIGFGEANVLTSTGPTGPCTGERIPQIATVAVVTIDKQADNRAEGVAIQSPHDQYNPEHARKVAIGRALDGLTHWRESRQAFWMAYRVAVGELAELPPAKPVEGTMGWLVDLIKWHYARTPEPTNVQVAEHKPVLAREVA